MGLFASRGRSAYRNVSGVWLVELRLRELRQLFEWPHPGPGVGLAFQFSCLWLRRALAQGTGHGVVAEGLLIIGWVALWRPVEIFLYDWWPIRQRQRHLESIARMEVEVVAMRPGQPPR